MTTQAASCRTRVALQNVGCKLNNYEVEALKNGFHGRGYEIVPFDAEADIYVVNTCTVTGAGDADSRKAVRRAQRTNREDHFRCLPDVVANMFKSILIANRGEIARRVIRTCRRLGIRTIAVYSEVDAGALHVREADTAVAIGPAPAVDSYMKANAVIAAAKAAGAEALHPRLRGAGDDRRERDGRDGGDQDSDGDQTGHRCVGGEGRTAERHHTPAFSGSADGD